MAQSVEDDPGSGKSVTGRVAAPGEIRNEQDGTKNSMDTRVTASQQNIAAPTAAPQRAGMLQRKCACGQHAPGGECQTCKQKKQALQRCAITYTDENEIAPPIVHDVLRSPGKPLDTETRETMESRLGRDFSQVPAGETAAHMQTSLLIGPPDDRYEQEADQAAQPVSTGRSFAGSSRPNHDFSGVSVHTGPAAAASAQAVHAKAYTVGEHIVFGAGRYNPSTGSGQQLLAHELAHVVQQRGTPNSGSLRRAPDDPEQPAAQVGLSVSISGLTFHVPEEITFKSGRKTPQLLAIVLQRLLGPQYKLELVKEVLAQFPIEKFKRAGGFLDRKPAKGGEPIRMINLGIEPTLLLIGFLKAKKLDLQISEKQEELLKLGFASVNLWADFNQILKAAGNPLPAWYTRQIFEQELAQQGKLLREYAGALESARAGDEAARATGIETVTEVIKALYGPAMVLEAIRRDISLAANDETSGIYSSLWKVPTPKKGEKLKVTTPPTRVRSLNVVVLFLGYMRTQPQLTLNAEVNQAERLELVKRYSRYTQQMLFMGSFAEGDQEIRDQPATANYPAFPSTLTPLSHLQPPLFDAALGTDHRFQMDIQFPSVYEVLGRYSFNWERVRIPDDKIGEPVDVSKLKGERPTFSEVGAVRFGRDTAYTKADIKKVIGEMSTDLGPAGVGALELVGANAILRYIGTGIRLGLEILTMPTNQKLIVFPSPGLYMVRSAMSQVREGNEEVKRAPSVAYFPVLARDPDEIAAGGVKHSLTAQEKAKERIKEIESKLSGSKLGKEERQQLQDELDALRLATAPLGERLEHRRSEIAKQIAAIESGSMEGDLDAFLKEKENIEKIIALRAKRKVADAELLTARFVSDLGQTIPLMLEVVDRSNTKKGNAHVYISDVTTPKSGDANGYGKTREDAIENGIRKLLESIHGYGRGRASVSLGGEIRTIRIDASLGSLLSESVENVATVLSIAAIAAAPFTGGASLSFLIPLGLVGAVPSAYRVLERVEAGTFELDLENALEIVNIAGSLIGLGRLGATSLRAMRIGKGLLIVGLGVDAAGGILMGAQLITQIEALSKLPPGERSAALLLLIGQTMVSTGVMVGGALAERGHQARAEAEGGKFKGLAEEKPSGVGEPTAKKPASPGAELLEKASADRDLNRLGRMDADSEVKLRSDEPLRKALVEQPRAAAALKKCASPCYPPGVTADQVKRLDRLLSRLGETGSYDEAALKKYLYDRRGDLDKAISQIEGVQNAGHLNSYLKFFNEGGEIKRLPPKGDPKILLAEHDRAHDFGVEKGRTQAQAEGKSPAGFTNPFERQGRYGQGFDDVMKKGPNVDLGEVFVVEYKGGDAVLAKGQMELDWIIGNIRRLYTEGGPAGQQWARTLAKALRDGRLKGVAYSTPVKDGQPQPTKTIATWNYPSTNIKLP